MNETGSVVFDMELRVNNLNVSLGGQKILKNIDVKVEHGELLALLGASGCGKSTLLKSIAGLLEIEDGTIYLGDRLLNSLAPEKRRAVIVFQDLRLFPHLSVERNITFAMEINKKKIEEQRQKVKELLQSVQLEGYEKKKISELSGGQMQRVALARALASEPDILLLDEPFSGLDERLREQMGDLVRKIQRSFSITTILVSHDKREALRLADKIVLMRSGVILQMASPYEIYHHPLNLEVAEYFGRINQIEGSYFRPGQVLLLEGEDYVIEHISFLGDEVELRLRALKEMVHYPDEIYASLRSSVFHQRQYRIGQNVAVKVEQ